MRKNSEQIEARKKFIKSCIDDPDLGADQLRSLACKIEQSTRVGDIVNKLADFLFLSEETIFKDYMDCKDTNQSPNKLREK